GGHVWTQRYEKGGIPQGPLTQGDKTPKHGTIIRFKPDASIFEETNLSFDTLSNRLRELAFLNRGLKIVIEDERDGRSHTFLYKGGIVEFVKHLNQNKTPIHRRSSTSRARRGTSRSRSPSSTTTATRRRCSPSRTTSTRARAAHTSPGSARPSRGATAGPRRCSRCGARSSTRKRRATTRCSPTTRSGCSSRRWARGSARRSSTSRSSAITRSS